MDWSPDGRLLLTPSQFIISWYEGVVAAASVTYNPSDPARWLPRAWVRSFLSQQLKGALHLFAALSVADGQKYGQTRLRKRFIDFQAFLLEVESYIV